jgi:hypothetical protein
MQSIHTRNDVCMKGSCGCGERERKKMRHYIFVLELIPEMTVVFYKTTSFLYIWVGGGR